MSGMCQVCVRDESGWRSQTKSIYLLLYGERKSNCLQNEINLCPDASGCCNLLVEVLVGWKLDL